jgi:two-component sensor histidine kinase
VRLLDGNSSLILIGGTIFPLLFLLFAMGYCVIEIYRRKDWALALSSLILVFMFFHQIVELYGFLYRQNTPNLMREIPETLVNTLGSLVIVFLADVRFELSQKTERLEKALAEKKTLLQEIHHRVKNNLQMVASMLSIQSQEVPEDKRSSFTDMVSRIQSMALLHEQLHTPDHVEELDTNRYFRELIDQSISSAAPEPSRIDRNISVEDADLELGQAVNCGMIVNELITNAIEHGLRDGEGTLSIEFSQSNDEYSLEVSDNGSGYPFFRSENKKQSTGLDLVETIAEEHLNGSLEISSNGTTTFRVVFPK